MFMGFQGIFPMNKHEYRAILCVLVYILIENVVFKICFKYLIFLENINIGHLKISTGLFLAPKIFRKEMDNISIRLAPMWQQSGTLLLCSCHGIVGFFVDELQIGIWRHFLEVLPDMTLIFIFKKEYIIFVKYVF